jgi:hypothetical protein
MEDDRIRLNLYIMADDDPELFEYFNHAGDYELAKYTRRLLRIGLKYKNNNTCHDSSNIIPGSHDRINIHKRHEESHAGNLSDVIDDSDIEL